MIGAGFNKSYMKRLSGACLWHLLVIFEDYLLNVLECFGDLKEPGSHFQPRQTQLTAESRTCQPPSLANSLHCFIGERRTWAIRLTLKRSHSESCVARLIEDLLSPNDSDRSHEPSELNESYATRLIT